MKTSDSLTLLNNDKLDQIDSHQNTFSVAISYNHLLLFFPVCAIIIFRTLNEEEVLKRDLTGYRDYCKKVRFRLIPFVW